jgi:hypothetical protein
MHTLQQQNVGAWSATPFMGNRHVAFLVAGASFALAHRLARDHHRRARRNRRAAGACCAGFHAYREQANLGSLERYIIHLSWGIKTHVSFWRLTSHSVWHTDWHVITIVMRAGYSCARMPLLPAHLSPLASGAAGIRHFVLCWEIFPIFR